MGQGLASYIRQKRGLSRIAIIYDQDNDTYSRPMLQAFSDEFNRMGGQVTTQVEFRASETPDFSLMVDQLKASNPDGVFIIASPPDTGFIAQTISLKNWAPALFAASWAQGDSLIQNGGKAVEGMEIIIAIDINDSSPTLKSFKEKFEQRFTHPPVFTAIEGYETMHMLASALIKTGGEADGLPGALIGLKDFRGLTGPIRLDEYGDAVRPLFIQRIERRTFKTIDTVTPEQ
jgi:branched-chain amino acid transport system substrate-binding protein